MVINAQPWQRNLSVLALLLLITTGCRQVERVEQQQDLPLRAWNRDLYDSEGIKVYATNSRAAREIAETAENAAKAFRRKTGEEPRQILFVAVDGNDPADDELLKAGVEGLARISGKPVPDLEESMKKEARRKGAEDLDTDEAVLKSMLGMIPGILESPSSRPPTLWKDAVVVPTSKRVDDGFDTIIEFVMEREEINTFQRLLMSPIIAIAKGYLHKILAAVQEAVIMGVHAQGREGWTQERIDQLLKDALEDSGLKQLGEDIAGRAETATGDSEESVENGNDPQQ